MVWKPQHQYLRSVLQPSSTFLNLPRSTSIFYTTAASMKDIRKPVDTTRYVEQNCDHCSVLIISICEIRCLSRQNGDGTTVVTQPVLKTKLSGPIRTPPSEHS